MGYMIEIICKVCGRKEKVPPLSKKDIDDGEELPDICQECPADTDVR